MSIKITRLVTSTSALNNLNYEIPIKQNYSKNNLNIENLNIDYIYINNYLIIHGKSNNIRNIRVTDTSNTYKFLINDNIICFAYKNELPEIKLYSNDIRINGLKIYGNNILEKVNNFDIDDNDYFCNYLQTNELYTQWKMSMDPNIAILYNVIDDPVIALCYLCTLMKKYFTYDFNITDNYLTVTTSIQIKKWNELMQSENKLSKGTLPIITGRNNTSIQGFFTKQYTNVDYWHEYFNESGVISSVNNCIDLYVSQILSTNPNHKPTLIISNNTDNDTIEFDIDESVTYVPTDPTIRNAYCQQNTINNISWDEIPIFTEDIKYISTNCNTGYRQKYTRLCNGAGNSSITSAACQIITCPVNNGFPQSNYSSNPVTINCPTGYTGSMTRVCGLNGWEEINSTACQIINTDEPDEPDEPEEPEESEEESSEYCSATGSWPQILAGSSYQADCTSPYEGKISRVCNSNGEWLAIDSSSCKLYCPASTIDDIVVPKTLAGSTYKTLCDASSSSYISIKCESDGKWDEIDKSECESNLWIWILVGVILFIVILIIIIIAKGNKKNDNSLMNTMLTAKLLSD